MGFIPIVLAFLGFIFLWAIVNYTTIQRIKAKVLELEQVFAQLEKQKKELSSPLEAILTEHDLLNPNLPSLSDWPDSPEAWFKKSFAATLAKDALQEHEALKELKGKYQLLKKENETNLRKIRAATYDYNDLTQQLPSSILAQVFGFRPLTLP